MRVFRVNGATESEAGEARRSLSIFLSMKQPFTDNFPENEAECRNLVRRIHHPSAGWAKMIDADDLWHGSFLKLAKRNPEVRNERSLFFLVKTTALNSLRDLGRRHAHRKPLFEMPLPKSTVRSLIGSSLETVVANEPSPSRQAELSDHLSVVLAAVATDAELEKLYGALVELSSSDNSLTYANIGRHVQMSGKRVSQSLKRLRSMAQQMI